MRVALAGARGFVGSALSLTLGRRAGVELVEVTRENCQQAREAGPYDVLINAAMPSKRFWARENPLLDFQETVAKTVEFYYNWKYKKFVQISSVSARCQTGTVYGRHKRAA